jgi:hypothetical protein
MKGKKKKKKKKRGREEKNRLGEGETISDYSFKWKCRRCDTSKVGG